MEYETVGAAVDGSAVGQPQYKVKAKRKPLEVFMNTLFFLCGMVAVAFVLVISIYLVISGLPAILEIGPIDFLFGPGGTPPPRTSASSPSSSPPSPARPGPSSSGCPSA